MKEMKHKNKLKKEKQKLFRKKKRGFEKNWKRDRKRKSKLEKNIIRKDYGIPINCTNYTTEKIKVC